LFQKRGVIKCHKSLVSFDGRVEADHYAIPGKFNWCLAALTVFRNQPFGEYVEGLSYCGQRVTSSRAQLKKHDFEYQTFFG
jgi:hypothetical protein